VHLIFSFPEVKKLSIVWGLTLKPQGRENTISVAFPYLASPKGLVERKKTNSYYRPRPDSDALNK
jgi:hypothetical protein